MAVAAVIRKSAFERFIATTSNGFHVDDSKVTLNVCLGKQFSGGELFLWGVRCEDHVNTETQSEEILDYSHVPGHTVLHYGRHRHGARPIKSGHRIKLLLRCRRWMNSFTKLNCIGLVGTCYIF